MQLCQAKLWNNKPGEVSFICRTNVDTASSLSPCRFKCSISLSLSSSFTHTVSLSRSVFLYTAVFVAFPHRVQRYCRGINGVCMCVSRMREGIPHTHTQTHKYGFLASKAIFFLFIVCLPSEFQTRR